MSCCWWWPEEQHQHQCLSDQSNQFQHQPQTILHPKNPVGDSNTMATSCNVTFHSSLLPVPRRPWTFCLSSTAALVLTGTRAALKLGRGGETAWNHLS